MVLYLEGVNHWLLTTLDGTNPILVEHVSMPEAHLYKWESSDGRQKIHAQSDKGRPWGITPDPWEHLPMPTIKQKSWRTLQEIDAKIVEKVLGSMGDIGAYKSHQPNPHAKFSSPRSQSKQTLTTTNCRWDLQKLVYTLPILKSFFRQPSSIPWSR